MSKGEIVIYQTDEQPSGLKVLVENETVWLTQAQMADLFLTSRNNITLHIGNIFKEKELVQDSVCKESLLTARDGKRYKTKIYNLDVIISVGYRVKSLRGTQFRIWANKVLKDFLLKGYALNQRVYNIERKLLEHDQKFEMLIQTNLPKTEGIYFDGQIFDAYSFVINLIKTAKKSIVLIDNYCDDSVLLMLSKRAKNVSAKIYTSKISKQFKLDIEKFHQQYDPIEIHTYRKSHDRFLIIDRKEVYHIGASLKDLGKKWFAFSKINISAEYLLEKLN